MTLANSVHPRACTDLIPHVLQLCSQRSWQAHLVGRSGQDRYTRPAPMSSFPAGVMPMRTVSRPHGTCLSHPHT